MNGRVSLPEFVNLHVLSPEETVYQGQVLWVQVPLRDGFIGIWPGHAPLIASLGKGDIVFDTRAGRQKLAVRSGILRVTLERCLILLGSFDLQRGDSGGVNDGLAASLEETLLDSLADDQIRELQEGQR